MKGLTRVSPRCLLPSCLKQVDARPTYNLKPSQRASSVAIFGSNLQSVAEIWALLGKMHNCPDSAKP